MPFRFGSPPLDQAPKEIPQCHAPHLECSSSENNHGQLELASWKLENNLIHNKLLTQTECYKIKELMKYDIPHHNPSFVSDHHVFSTDLSAFLLEMRNYSLIIQIFKYTLCDGLSIIIHSQCTATIIAKVQKNGFKQFFENPDVNSKQKIPLKNIWLYTDSM